MSRKKNMLRHKDDEDELVIETDAEKTSLDSHEKKEGDKIFYCSVKGDVSDE